jgi:hypothetical protein
MRRALRRSFGSFTGVASTLLLAGCELPEPVQGWVASLTGGTPASKTVAPTVSASPSLEEAIQRSARRAQSNAEFLQEMFRVVLLKEAQGNPEFTALLDTLNQGATLEGVYNGLVHSAAYRELEASSAPASPAVLRAFAEELAALELELPERTLFDAMSGKPLAKIEMPTGSESAASAAAAAAAKAEAAAPQKAAGSAKDLANEYMKVFVGASHYTLKRVIGDEALKVVAAKTAKKTELVEWYVKFVTVLAERKVDFGLELRNKPDREFHLGWAMTASLDKLQWEVLNRLHRVMNVGLAKR